VSTHRHGRAAPDPTPQHGRTQVHGSITAIHPQTRLGHFHESALYRGLLIIYLRHGKHVIYCEPAMIAYALQRMHILKDFDEVVCKEEGSCVLEPGREYEGIYGVKERVASPSELGEHVVREDTRGSRHD
jgi:hypothetical protein